MVIVPMDKVMRVGEGSSSGIERICIGHTYAGSNPSFTV